MHQEVELKALVKDLDNLMEKFEELGVERVGFEHQEDIYLNPPHKNYAITDEALRIRRVTDENDERIAYLTYKGPKLDSKSKTREEVEIPLTESENDTVKLLGFLGFKEAIEIVKDRTLYKYKQFTICLDEVEGLSDIYLEMEVLVPEKEDYRDLLKEMFNLYKELGISGKRNFITDSYLDLVEGKHLRLSSLFD